MKEYKPHIFQTKHYTREEITTELLQECYEHMAKVVVKYGEDYLPIFQRFHDELEKRKANDNMVKLAQRIANDNN